MEFQLILIAFYWLFQYRFQRANRYLSWSILYSCIKSVQKDEMEHSTNFEIIDFNKEIIINI